MADEPEELVEPGTDDSEAKFWERMGREIEERAEAAFARHAAKSAPEPEEEAERERVSFEARKKPGAKPKEAPDDGGTEGVQESEREPSDAERRRLAGGVGPGQPSGYWDRVGHRLLYGKRRRP